MRKIFDPQLTFGQTPIEDIKIDMRSRDEIPKLLLGLKHIYCDKELRQAVFDILETVTPERVDSKNGRPGMDLWKILLMGTIRLNCNWDYDKLQEIANNHKTMRQMLGHGMMDDDKTYPLQTLKDNVSLLTPEALDKKEDQTLMGRCDSFVLETDVHDPTDINLLFDAVRKMIQIAAMISQGLGMTLWRQYDYNIRSLKKLYRIAQKLKHSTSKDEKKKAQRKQLIIEAHANYIESAKNFVKTANFTIEHIVSNDPACLARIEELKTYIDHANRQIDQIRPKTSLF